MANAPLQRYIAAILVFLLLFSAFPVTATAEEAPTEPPTEQTAEPTEVTEPSVAEDPTEATETPTEATETSAEESTEAAEEILPEESEEATEEPRPFRILPVEEEREDEEINLYFGQLHAHTGLASGSATLTEMYQAASTAMDFFAVTEYSENFDRTAGKAAAKNASGEGFTGLYGFEMNWPESMQIGHISVFNTPGLESWEENAYQNPATVLETFYQTLSEQPGVIAQWNHPGNQYGTFLGFNHYSRETDKVITLLEVANTPANTAVGYLDGYQYYTRALDKGWHIAPTNSQAEAGRTVICAQFPDEQDLYDAMASYRVYATKDCDLDIYYTMDGHFMGSVLKTRHIGNTADIFVELEDPTDSAIGLVEVIVDGGLVADTETIHTSCDVAEFSLPADYSYYYLRITQPDGDMAVTAPIWVESNENLGISTLTCETDVPVQAEETRLTLSVYNYENADFWVDTIEILADGVCIAEDTALDSIPADTELSHDLTFSFGGIGHTEITVVLSGTLEGAAREYERTLTLSFRLSEQITDIVVDGAHGNAGLSDLLTLKTMAAKEDIHVAAATDGITVEMLQNCRLLLVTAPSVPFPEEFLSVVSEFVSCGGSVLLCGQSETLDSDISSSSQLNRLLGAIGSTMRLGSDTVVDSQYNGGDEALLFPDDINTDSPWCDGVAAGQVYRYAYGCSVNPGNGTALVNCRPTAQTRSSATTVLACEETEAGGVIFAAGSRLPGNTELKAPASIWDAPYANRTIVRNLLDIGGEALPLSTIRQARKAAENMPVRIRGYVTAGTANPYNRFPNTVYVQDDTGGIAVIPFVEDGISVGTPVEITGIPQTVDGNRILKPISWEALEQTLYQYLPKTGDWKTLLDPDLHGGELVEVEGKCKEVILSEDGFVTDILLEDKDGNEAFILIEDFIFSGATGKNELDEDIRVNRTVRAIGLLHVDENGDAVVRVRNCEEVVYVPPRRIYINPRTGDIVLYPAAILAMAPVSLALLKKKRRS